MSKIREDVGSTKGASIPRPLITLSYAQTLDGRLATSTGSSQWISALQSLRFSHELCAEHEAIMVGAGTVCVDDPRLTVRLAAGQNPQRVVVDSTLRSPLTAYGEDLVFDGRIEYPGTPPKTLESEENLGCVTA